MGADSMTCRIVAYSKVKIKRSLFATVVVSASTAVNHGPHVEACGSKEEIVRQYPEPVSDVKSRDQRCHARANVEIGKCCIEKFWNPDLLRQKRSGFACDLLGLAMLWRWLRGIAGDHLIRVPCRSNPTLTALAA